jgi:hypothetical protein
MFYQKYANLISVFVKHEFYKDKLSPDFNFTPFPNTLTLLNAYGLVTRIVNGGLFVYQQQEKDGKPMQPIDKLTDLFFTVEVKTDILNITTRFDSGRYWFSNLNEDGTYSTLLTEAMQLSELDAVQLVTGQTTTLRFKKATIDNITINKIYPFSGLQRVDSYDINAERTEQEIKVAQPGLYYIEQQFKAGGSQTTKVILHDELKNTSAPWGILHLQLQPDAQPETYELELQPLKSSWRYLLLEPQSRPVALVPGNLSFAYSKNSSRYPAGIVFNRKNPNTYSASLLQEIEAIKKSDKIKEVHVFESDRTIALMDGSLPVIKISSGGNEVASNIAIPSRTMKETKILFKL